MTYVSRIEWEIKTSNVADASTDSKVELEIFRDETSLEKIVIEPGATKHLNTGWTGNYYWVFQKKVGPYAAGVTANKIDIPIYAEEFPNGVAGHLKIKLIIHSYDAWLPESVTSIVYSGETKPDSSVPGGQTWDPHTTSYTLKTGPWLSTDSTEGVSTYSMTY